MAPLLLKLRPQRKTGTRDLDDTTEESISFTSAKSLTAEERGEEAASANERLRFPTGDFDTAYEMRRAKRQITSVGSLEEAGSVLADRNISFEGMPEQTPDEIGISLRETEKAWMESHMKEFSAFAGEWLVVEGRQLVAHSADLVKAVKEARSRGVQVPYVTRLPLEKGKPFIG